ncbi:cation:proton antiporter [Neisseria perflava]|uniref:cation:proton antiporter n=1 Tax=Neisseria perflava TaxID=33053 RepID=UPI0020A02DF8|nr:cation:proton antiporter [Neisseria perflava]MCP1659623.1 CPA1 family monovalent cation:H+ antiporter [Neisseria perflava]MCP1771806.1 CPA1 family monovalent cation:H+ antiporter [Neisseria perflava]
MGSYLFLEALVVIFLLSMATTLFNKHRLGLPDAIGVPIVSAWFVFLLQWSAGLMNQSDVVSINIDKIEAVVRGFNFYDFLVNGVICFILMASALKFKASDLKKYWKPIGILATLALLLCALIYSGLTYAFLWAIGYKDINFTIVLLMGAALGATDPVGIKGVLGSVRAPHHLMVKLEGESLFNDAMCIALFMAILKLAEGGTVTVGGVTGLLLMEVVVAVLIGFVAGKVTLLILRLKQSIESLIMTTGLLATGSYLVALLSHASAPIACVVAGLVVGNKWQEILSQKDINEVNHFWHLVEGIINAFLFTLIGLELFIVDFDMTLLLGGIASFIFLHIARFAGNFLAFAFFPSVRRKSFNGSLTILSWGGVRGGISLALVLAVATTVEVLQPYSDILIGYTFIAVLLSGVVCGLGLPQVMNAFYHNENEPKEGFAGWYQRMCHKLNRQGFQYVVSTAADGSEVLTVYEPQTLVEKMSHADTEKGESVPTVAEIREEMERLEHPDNF